MIARRYMVLIFCLFVTGCSHDGPKVGTIEERDIKVQREVIEHGGRSKAIESYREFLDKEENDPLRAEAMRRLADLQLEEAEAEYLEKARRLEKEKDGAGKLKPADYSKAIQNYRELLRTHPNYPGNDRVAYQLARAYEQSGDYKRALRTLDRLVSFYPSTKFIDEVQFRRGELLFVMKSYRKSEQAYGSVLDFGDVSLFYERALYKHGWSIFKQSRYESALGSFFRLLDRKLVDHDAGISTSETPSLTRGEKELADDAFRVVTLSFSHLGGEKAITKYFKKKGKRPYEATVYDNLGVLYLEQQRYVDAANAFTEFIKQYGNDRRAPLFQVKVIQSYEEGGFPTLLLKSKEEFVVRYGVNSKFWPLHDKDTHAAVAPHLKKNIEDLARHFHAQAQETKGAADYHQAARWYAEFVQAFPRDPQAPDMNFLLAETLFDGGRYGDAAVQYEKTAYAYAPHARSAEAGYAALLAHKKREEELRGNERTVYQRQVIKSALRFGDAFPDDKRAAAVLTKAAEDLFALNETKQAATVARRVIGMKPRPKAALRRTAWTVVAHAEFEGQAFAQAETAYKAVLRLTPAKDPKRTMLVERLASSVYKQGEQLRAAGDVAAAVKHFLRVKNVAPRSSVTPTAEYDAAAALMTLQDWRGAARVLETFRKKFPDHPLQRDVPDKLAVVYLESKQWLRAAAVFELITDQREDAAVRQQALWQAGELYEKAAQKKSAVAVYKRYIDLFPDAFEQAIEARYKLAKLHKTGAQRDQHYHWLRQIVEAADAGRQRTERTQYLAAKAAFLLAERDYWAFRDIRLVIPLAKSLRAKKQKMQVALKAYGRAVDYGVAEFTTASTFRIADVYHTLSEDLLASQRPRGLSALEREQYDVLLEEQAYPFEEKAIEIHETNVRRVADNVYDEWVKKSFGKLRKLRPVRYAKFEKREAVSNAIQ
ncbi:MAG: tol-pal system YbgF family protein [Acidiferrobacterales bacterium]